MLTIVGFLWRDPLCAAKYEPEQANIWARMIDRNLKIPHRFVLMTDYPDADYDPLIEPVKLWDDWRDLRHPNWVDGGPHCYLRLKAFSEEVRPIFGDRFVVTDLDILVKDDLTPLFDRPEDFVILHRPNFNPLRERNKYQGGMWMMTTGARKRVWDDFRGLESIADAAEFMGTDQAWIRYKLGPNEAGWTVSDGILKFGDVKSDQNHGGYEKYPPKNTRLIFFLGGDQPRDYVGRDQPRCAHCRQPAKLLPPYRLPRLSREANWDAYQWIGEFYR